MSVKRTDFHNFKIRSALLLMVLMPGAWAAPTVDSPIDDLTVDEDAADAVYDLSAVFDDGGDTLTYSVVADGSVFSSTVVGNTLTLSFIADANHPAPVVPTTVTVTATDSTSASVSDSFDVTVNAVDDDPVEDQGIDDEVVSEDSDAVVIDLDATDAFDDADILTNGDSLSYAVSGPTGPLATTDVSGNLLTLTFTADAHGGPETVTVTATDLDGAPTATTTFKVTVTPANDPPTVESPIDDLTVDEDAEDQVYELSSVFDDIDIVDGDSLDYEVAADGSVFSSTIDDSTLTLSFIADANHPAPVVPTTVTVTATDSESASVSDAFDVTVNEVNDDPVVDQGIADLVVSEDSDPVEIDLEATGAFDDVDIATNGDALSYEVSGPSGPLATTDVSGSVLTLTFTADAHGGPETLTVTATDSNGPADVTTTFQVTVTPANDPPTVESPIDDLTVDEDAEDQVYELSSVFDDIDIVDGDSLDYEVAADGSVFSSTIDGSTLTLSFIADANHPAPVVPTTVTVTATDSESGSVSDSFDVTVFFNDTATTEIGLMDQTVDEDFAPFDWDISVGFADVDIATNGDSLSYTVDFDGAPVDTATIPVGSSILTLTSLPDQNGVTRVTVTATDAQGPESVSTFFDLIVTSANDAPVVVPPPIDDRVVDEDSGTLDVSFAGVFDDVDIDTDGDVLTYEAAVSGDAVFSSAVVSGTSVALTTAADQNGVAKVTLTATDSGVPALSVSTSFDVTVNPINDAPTLVAPIADRTLPEDGSDIVIPLYPPGAFDDVDVDTNADTLAFAVITGNPGLFDGVSTAGGVLTLSLAPDQHGTSTVNVTVTDSMGASISDSFTVTAFSVNDLPVAGDSSESMNEDEPGITVTVMDNVSSPDGPATTVSAGITMVVGGVSFPNSSESAPTIVVDPFGNQIELPNGRVTITGNAVFYEPKPDFQGADFFTYTISDPEGDQASGTISVNVVAVNDQPIGIQEHSFTMLEAGVLAVPATEGVFSGAYDVDGKMLDGAGNEIGSPLVGVAETAPANGALVFDGLTGAFVYTPNIAFTGDDTFTYRLSDGTSSSSDPAYVVRISVIPVPPAAPPPPPGTVSQTYTLSQTPLEQLATIPANVQMLLDDSGSMDWNSVVTDDQGGAYFGGTVFLSNATIADTQARATNYPYLFDLTSNAYHWNTQYGRVLATEAALAADADTDNNEYGVWRARNATFNRIYYDPENTYAPWIGTDSVNQPFAPADPAAARLDPTDPGTAIDLTQLVSYASTQVPNWDASGGYANVAVNNFYIPTYNATTATPPLAWNDSFSKIEIRDGAGPLTGGTFPGGRNRVDCELADGDPLDCSFAEELQNFANWFVYYRSREYVMKAGVGRTIAQVENLRVGFDTLNNNESEEIREMNTLYTEGNKKLLMDKIYRVGASGSTPMREALDRGGKTFECASGGGLPCPVLPPPDGVCQQNFTLLFSDGFWNGSGPGGPSLNQDEDGPGPFDGGRYADGNSQTLADIAMNYYERDLHPALSDLVPVGNRDFGGAPVGTFPGLTAVMHQHMKTFVVGFGLQGTFDPDTVPADPTTAFPWTNPADGVAEKIDDMVHVATNGRGAYLNANNPAELQAAFEDAFREFTQSASSVSATAFNSTSLQQETLLFRGYFDLRDNTGDLIAVDVNSDGTLGGTRWSASDQLDTLVMTDSLGSGHGNRNIVSYDSDARAGIPFRFGAMTLDQQASMTSSQVDWVRGSRLDEVPVGTLRARPVPRGLLGDIINSSPVFVGVPRSLNRDQAPFPVTDLYSEFVSSVASRTPVVYVGANDGMLHGFNASTGDEMISYVPNKLYDAGQSYANALSGLSSPFHFHQYFVDLTPRLNDAYVRANASTVGKSWNSVLIGGLGAAGKGYFALNVTDPDTSFATENEASNAVLWEFTDDDDTYPVDGFGVPLGGAVGAITDPLGLPIKDLGYAHTTPTIAMTNVADGGTSAERKWAVITGNGYNSTAGIAKLFVMFVDDGLDGWQPGDFVKIDTGAGVPNPPAQKAGLPNALGAPALVDKDLNGTVDLAYAGDLLGNLWRFNLEDPEPANWTVTRLFTATYNDGSIDVLQPITTQPTVVKHPHETGFIVTFGTGSFITRDDAASTEIQSVYGIWDRGESVPATAAADTKSLRLVEQVVTNVVVETGTESVTRRAISENAVDYEPAGVGFGTYGWYFDFDMPRAATTTTGNPNPDMTGQAPPAPQYPGEKAIRKFLLREGVVITPTVLPAADGSSCFGTRPGAIMLFDVVTGGNPQFPVIDFDNDGVVDENDLVDVGGELYAAGLLFNQTDLEGALVDMATLGGEGDTDWLFVSGGGETSTFRIIDIADDRTGRLAWRELDDAN